MSKLRNPFPGLRPFNAKEVHLFFGRESQVDTMIDKLAAHRFLAVIGTSGSGKSSLVDCGLRPALFRGALSAAGTSWRIAKFRPGHDPISSLTRALSKEGLLFKEFPSKVSIEEVVDTHLRMSKRGLIELVRKARMPEHTNLLIIADQFEELFRYSSAVDGADAATRNENARAFINLLLEPHLHQSQRIHVVLTMRSDFLGDCSTFEGLPEAINRGQYLVPRMTRDERRSAISGPIHVAGATIEPILLTRLVNDVGDNPDQLSILQHALNRTWAHWEDRAADGPISLDDYLAIGTMDRALNNHADETFATLANDSQRTIASRIFRALTDTSSDIRGIRRPTRFSELCKIVDAPTDAVKEVIEVFRQPSCSFLMPPFDEAIDEQTIIDISHESLMRVWRKLDRWSKQEASDAENYRRLAQSAEKAKKDEIDPMSGTELKTTRDWWNRANPNSAWAQRYHPGFELSKAFLEISEKIERRKRMIQRSKWGAIAGLVFIAIVYGIYEQVAAFRATEALNQERLKQFADADLNYRRGIIDLALDAVENANGTLRPLNEVSIQDIFDINGGFLTNFNSDAARMFGATASPGEDQLSEDAVKFFPDATTVDSVEWQLSSPQTIASVNLVAISDPLDRGYARAISNFKLYYRPLDAQPGEWEKVADYSPRIPYGGTGNLEGRGIGNALSVCLNLSGEDDSVNEVLGQEFKAEFANGGTNTFFGVRIVELDGNAEPCPEASSDREQRKQDAYDMWMPFETIGVQE